jgi:hypothetical protein
MSASSEAGTVTISEAPALTYNKSNTMSASSEAGTVTISEAPALTYKCKWGSCCSFFSFVCGTLSIIVCFFCCSFNF